MVGLVLVLSIVLNITGLIVGLVIVRNSLRKEENYEEIIQQQHEYVLSIRDQVKRSYSNMKSLDAQDMFEKDDEVGGAFAGIVDIVRELDAYVNAADAEEGEENL